MGFNVECATSNIVNNFFGCDFVFVKGQKLEQFVGRQTGFMFDIVESCGVLFIIVDEENLERFKLGGHYDFWCSGYNETLFFAAKIRSNPWYSAPYTPHLSSAYMLTEFDRGKGMPLTVVLVSNADGIIEDIDFLTLGNTFSNSLYLLCEDILKKPFDMQRHQLTIQAVYQKFANDDLLTTQPGATYSID